MRIGSVVLFGYASPTGNATACSLGCSAATIPVVGFIRVIPDGEIGSYSIQVAPELTCQRCTDLGCPSGCVAGESPSGNWDLQEVA